MEQFVLKDWRVITSVTQMSFAEVEQWISYLWSEESGLALCLEEDNSKNIFDSKYEDQDHYNEELWIYEWIWTPNPSESHKLTDIFGWPGDNQDGAVFVDDEFNPVFLNGDMDVVVNRDTANVDSRLEKVRGAFAHLRYCQEHDDDDDNCPNLEWCRKYWR